MISHHYIVNGAWVLLPSMSLSPFVTTPSKTNEQIYFTVSVNLTHQILVLYNYFEKSNLIFIYFIYLFIFIGILYYILL